MVYLELLNALFNFTCTSSSYNKNHNINYFWNAVTTSLRCVPYGLFIPNPLNGILTSIYRRYMAEILPIRRKTLSNQSIDQSQVYRRPNSFPADIIIVNWFIIKSIKEYYKLIKSSGRFREKILKTAEEKKCVNKTNNNQLCNRLHHHISVRIICVLGTMTRWWRSQIGNTRDQRPERIRILQYSK